MFVFPYVIRPMRTLQVTLALLLLTFLCTCGPAPEPPPPDVSHINAPLTVVRFDRAVMDLDTNNIAQAVQDLENEYGEFADLYLRNITPVRRADFSPEEQLEVLKALLRYQPIRYLDSLAQAKFTDERMAELTGELQQALRYYHYYLPNAPLPDTLTTFLFEFSYAGLLYGDTDLAAGLEFYLGPEFDYSQVSSQEPIFSEYLARTYRPEYLPQKLMRVLIEDQLPRPRAGRLIDYLIYEGKKLYLLEKVLPNADDEVVYEVTPEQVNWLKENEIAIYAYLQKEDLLFSTDQSQIRKLTQPAPYTQGMPQESPGRAVNYLGKKIVEAYVAAHPNVTMAELIRMEDGQKLLAGARYKPK